MCANCFSILESAYANITQPHMLGVDHSAYLIMCSGWCSNHSFTWVNSICVWFRIIWVAWHHRLAFTWNTIVWLHYNDDIMSTMASQITSLTTVYLTVYSRAVQRKQQSSASLAFVRGIHRWPVNSPHKWPVTRKMFPFDDVIIW